MVLERLPLWPCTCNITNLTSYIADQQILLSHRFHLTWRLLWYVNNTLLGGYLHFKRDINAGRHWCDMPGGVFDWVIHSVWVQPLTLMSWLSNSPQLPSSASALNQYYLASISYCNYFDVNNDYVQFLQILKKSSLIVYFITSAESVLFTTNRVYIIDEWCKDTCKRVFNDIYRETTH